jgi:hypothetical protein
MHKKLLNGDTVYITPAERPASLFNDDTWVGALFGALGGLGGAAVGSVSLLAGALIGGWVGKRDMDREMVEGRPVNPPTIWNRTIAKGMLIGLAVGMVAAGGYAVAAFGVAALSTALGTAVISSLGPSIGLSAPIAAPIAIGNMALTTTQAIHGILAIGGLAGSFIGGVAGSVMGKRRMAKDYENAKRLDEIEETQLQRERGLSGRAPQQALSSPAYTQEMLAPNFQENEMERRRHIQNAALEGKGLSL